MVTEKSERSFARRVVTKPLFSPATSSPRRRSIDGDLSRARSDPSGSAPRPLERNSTSVRASTDVLARYVRIDCVRIVPGGRSRRDADFRRGGGGGGGGRHRAFLHVLFHVTYPFLNCDLPALPHELADRDHAGDAHPAHKHHEDAADVRQAELVRRRAALRRVVLIARNID